MLPSLNKVGKCFFYCLRFGHCKVHQLMRTILNVFQSNALAYMVNVRVVRMCLFGSEIGCMKNVGEKIERKTCWSVFSWVGMKENK